MLPWMLRSWAASRFTRRCEALSYMSGGGFELKGGFWNVNSVPENQVYLPGVLKEQAVNGDARLGHPRN